MSSKHTAAKDFKALLLTGMAMIMNSSTTTMRAQYGFVEEG
jgi:hypothetical protein